MSFGPPSGVGGPPSGSGAPSGSGGSSSGGGGGPSGGGGAPFDLNYVDTVRLAHSVIASLAWVIFFPSGAIAMRLIPGRFAIWIHAGFQLFGYVLFIIGAALGIKLALTLEVVAGNMFTQYHPVIGLLLFALLFFQPILGLLHHIYFKRVKRRTFWSHAHIWLGRLLITLGIINGGLGLLYSASYESNIKTGYIVYGVVAGVMWCVWVAAAVYGEVKRMGPPESRKPMGEMGQKRGSGSGSGSSSDLEPGNGTPESPVEKAA